MADTTSDIDIAEDRPLSTADLAQAADRPDGAREGLVAQPEQGTDPLLPEQEVSELRSRWDGIQAGFVDEPRRAVQDADALVAAAMQRLAEIFASERSNLEGQWDRGDSVSTEELRIALQRYRSFFTRLLSV